MYPDSGHGAVFQFHADFVPKALAFLSRWSKWCRTPMVSPRRRIRASGTDDHSPCRIRSGAGSHGPVCCGDEQIAVLAWQRTQRRVFGSSSERRIEENVDLADPCSPESKITGYGPRLRSTASAHPCPPQKSHPATVTGL
jgi:hypothetical protein